MNVLEVDVKVGDGVVVGGLRVFPLTSEQVGGPAYLTGPEAYEAGLIEVGELDPPEVPKLSVTNLADLPILLVEGEMLIGGDQNRTMNVTVLCPPAIAHRRARFLRGGWSLGWEADHVHLDPA